MKLTIYPLGDNAIPALLGRVPAGPSADPGYEIELIDLNQLFGRSCPDSFLLKFNGTSMVDEIADGDYGIVSRTAPPDPGDIVVAWIDGGVTVKYFEVEDRRGHRHLTLVPANKEFPRREVTEDDEFEIFGVVKWVIHDAKPRFRPVAVASGF